MVSKLVEGIDYVMEGDLLVFTAAYHLKRGHCCNSKCRNCPYGLAPGGPPKMDVPSIRILGLGRPDGSK